ncbi:hypothetical protein O181_018455 [Austropuccinia psidii MF-1]|uniref:Integrase catalytic domain-containing protein n=1 Tax=Austropuccinia psidii MF-1 TaxID=1389203 RepID=A0A9Q3C9V9_9BASI|nr:hypothetical protein [Austropuccinia psidii MF-1]
MGPFATDPQGFHYLGTVRNHTLTYSVVYPLKACSDTPKAILDAIKQLQVRLRSTPKALRMDNAREFTSFPFALSLAKLGTLGDMAQSMILESRMPNHFWRFAYASVCFLHNQLPNSQCPKLSPHERLFSHPPSIGTLYPFGAKAIVHVPAVQQPHKLAPRGIACQPLKPLMTGGWLLWEPKRNKMIQSASVIFPRF